MKEIAEGLFADWKIQADKQYPDFLTGIILMDLFHIGKFAAGKVHTR